MKTLYATAIRDCYSTDLFYPLVYKKEGTVLVTVIKEPVILPETRAREWAADLAEKKFPGVTVLNDFNTH